jgi:hypothetical protein
MDLERLSLGGHANALLNAYLRETGDVPGLATLPLFLSCRAAVRAKTRATAARLQSLAGRRADDAAAAARYLDLADRLLHPPPCCLVAIGGRSGSGKSSLARMLASHVGPAPGAVIVQSDDVRKQLLGVAAHDRLEPAAYTPAASRRVYEELAGRVQAILRTGHGAVADATFLRVEDRHLLERIARDAGVPFVGVWLNAPEPTLIQRVAGRKADVSDATGEVIRAQGREDVGSLTWHHVDAAQPPDRVLEDAMSFVRAVLRITAPDDIHGGASV